MFLLIYCLYKKKKIFFFFLCIRSLNELVSGCHEYNYVNMSHPITVFAHNQHRFVYNSYGEGRGGEGEGFQGRGGKGRRESNGVNTQQWCTSSNIVPFVISINLLSESINLYSRKN